MGNLDNFKNFVKKNPHLIHYVNNEDYTWQKFYEMYDLYGEEHEVWNDFVKQEKKEEPQKKEEPKKNNPWEDILNYAKNIDVDKMQSGIQSIQKAIGLVGELFLSKDDNVPNMTSSNYEPRPIYRRFED